MSNEQNANNDIAKEFYEKSDRRTADLEILLDKLEKSHENLSEDIKDIRKFLKEKAIFENKNMFEQMRRSSAMGLRGGAEDLDAFPMEVEIRSLGERVAVLRELSKILTKLPEISPACDKEKEDALKILKEEIAALEELAPGL